MTELEVEIRQLEEKLLHGDVRDNPELVDQLLAEEFEEIGQTAYIATREDVVQWLAQKEPGARWRLTDFRIKPLSADLVLAIYRANKIDSSSRGSLRSSIWKRSGDSWKMIFHQGTKILSE